MTTCFGERLAEMIEKRGRSWMIEELRIIEKSAKEE